MQPPVTTPNAGDGINISCQRLNQLLFLAASGSVDPGLAASPDDSVNESLYKCNQILATGTFGGGGGGGVAWGAITGTLGNQTDLSAALALKAPLASPALTGNPTAPTQTAGDNSTKIATTAFASATALVAINTANAYTDSAVAAVTPVPGQVVGTSTNDDAVAGNVGEYVFSTVAANFVTLTNNTAATCTSINLTAGDWDVEGIVDYTLSAASTTAFQSGSSDTDATFDAQDSYAQIPLITTLLSSIYGAVIPVQRYSLSAPATVYLIAKSSFSAGTVKAGGTIRARRVR